MPGTPALDRVLAAVRGGADARALPEGHAAASAPASVELIGDPCARAGGMLLTAAAGASAAVALGPAEDDALVIRAGGEEHRMPMPEATPDGLPRTAATVAAAVVALRQTVPLIPRTGRGLTVTVASDIPSRRGLGERAAIGAALALAANEIWGDRDDVPTRARYAAALHEAQAAHLGRDIPLHPYTVALRARAGHVALCNHADGAVTQVPVPDHLRLLVACSPDVTGAEPPVARDRFFAEACRAFGVPTLAELPDADTRVLEWIRARHQVDPDSDAPTESRAAAWLERAGAGADRCRAISGHLRHGDVAAALNTVAVDIRDHGGAPDADAPLGQLAAAADAAGALVRPLGAPAAALVAWAPAGAAAATAAAIRAAGGSAIPVAATPAGLPWGA